MKSLPVFLKTPARVVITVGLIVLVIEFLIMLLISGVTEGSSLDAWHFVDPILLTALVAPALYILIFRPMRNQQVELERQLDELRHNEQLTALIETLPDAVFLRDGEGRWLVTNEPARQMFQLHNLPWQGKTGMELADLRPALRATHEGYLASDEKAWQAGKLLVGEEIVAGEDGRRAIMEMRKVPLFGNEGQRKGLVIIGRDITQRKHAEEELLRSHEQLRELTAYSDKMIEVERKRIAREVHDELGQQLTALRMSLSFVAQQHGEDHEMVGQMAELRLLVDQMVGVVRHVVSNLRPAPLDLGIVPALEWLADDFEQHSGIRCRLRMLDMEGGSGDTLMLDDARATAVFRIVQESLTNVARHSAADEVTISLDVTNDFITLEVADNGKGFDSDGANTGRSFGLLGMHERVLLLHGALQINSVPGSGTTVSLSLPVDRRAQPRNDQNGARRS